MNVVCLGFWIVQRHMCIRLSALLLAFECITWLQRFYNHQSGLSLEHVCVSFNKRPRGLDALLGHFLVKRIPETRNV